MAGLWSVYVSDGIPLMTKVTSLQPKVLYENFIRRREMTKKEAIELELCVQKRIAQHLGEIEDRVFVSLALSNLFKVQIIDDGEYLFNRDDLEFVCFKNYNNYTYLSTLEFTKDSLEYILNSLKEQIIVLLDLYDNRRELEDLNESFYSRCICGWN